MNAMYHITRICTLAGHDSGTKKIRENCVKESASGAKSTSFPANLLPSIEALSSRASKGTRILELIIIPNENDPGIIDESTLNVR